MALFYVPRRASTTRTQTISICDASRNEWFIRIWVDATIVERINAEWKRGRRMGKNGEIKFEFIDSIPQFRAHCAPLENASVSHFVIYSWNDWSFFFVGPIWLTRHRTLGPWFLCCSSLSMSMGLWRFIETFYQFYSPEWKFLIKS